MWDIKYRPMVFADVLGQEGSIRVLLSRLRKGEAFDASYIFAGGHGSGKTTLARILARAMFCREPQEGNPCNRCEHCTSCLNESMAAFMELDAASQGTTADMRRIVDNLVYAVPGATKRIYLLDEAHRMSRDAQDVLLKPIEDKRVVVILCTTELGKIRETIKSRCEVYEIRKIQRDDILARVKYILALEGVAAEDDAILTVIDHAKGHVRDVLNRLETVAQLGPITMEAVRERLDLSVVSLYYEILLALGDPGRAIGLVETVCDRVGAAQASIGLAEAAMNSYRQANKIQADFSQIDRELAERVFAQYGASTPALAQYFLRSEATSSLDVVCDVMACCNAGGVPTGEQTANTAPIQVSVVAHRSATPEEIVPAAVIEPVQPPQATATPVPPPPSERPPSTPLVPVVLAPARGTHAEWEQNASKVPKPRSLARQPKQEAKVDPRVLSANAGICTEVEFTPLFNRIRSFGTAGGEA